MKLVHKPLTAWIFSLCVSLAALLPTRAEEPSKAAYIAFFDPAKGFKPAQTNLTDIFLQLAGSLEHYGSPEQYLRHIAEEHKRVALKFREKTGKELTGHFPTHITDQYIAQLTENWKLLTPKLRLDGLAKDAGLCTREAIRGTRDTGTILVEVFNRHQKLVADAMQGGTTKAGYELLETEVVKELELSKEKVAVNAYEVPRRDAVSYGQILRGVFTDFNNNLDATLKPDMAKRLRTMIGSVFSDLGRLAQSELELGILDAALN